MGCCGDATLISSEMDQSLHGRWTVMWKFPPVYTESEEREDEQIPEPENGGRESPRNTALQPENNSTEPEQEAADSSIRRYPSQVRQLPDRYQ